MPSWVKNTSVYLEFQLIELFLLQKFLYAYERLSNKIPKYFALKTVLISPAGL